MKRDRRIRDLTGATQRFRRRVLANLDARIDALFSLEENSQEARHARRALARARDVIAEMR